MNLSRILLGGALLQIALVPAMRAHNPDVHQMMVRDAITYILSYGTPSQKAALARLAADAGGMTVLRTQLADEAKLTDNYEDLAWYSNSKVLIPIATFLVGGRTFFEYDGLFVGRLQHFLNADRVPQMWDRSDGYYYQWSSKQGDDKDAMSSWLVSAADLEVDNEYSIALPRYQPYWRGTVSQWERNWEYDWVPGGDDWDIENTRFAPVTALAHYWYRRYIGFPFEGARTQFAKWLYSGQTAVRVEPRKIRGVQLLGPVAHAAADVTVPQHTIGACGFGHQHYEDDFEDQYERGNIAANPAGIARHLRDRSFLRSGTSAAGIGIENVQVTLVTGDEDGSGTDADIFIDLGTGREYELDTSMDDFERWNDDTFTLKMPAGTLISDLQRIRIRRASNGSEWKLKALYVLADGVLLYANGRINHILRDTQTWQATDFRPLARFANPVWRVDEVLMQTASYALEHTKGQIGAANLRSTTYWNSVYTPAALISPMQHLLDLGVAAIVRTIEMSQVERRVVLSPSVPIDPPTLVKRVPVPPLDIHVPAATSEPTAEQAAISSNGTSVLAEVSGGDRVIASESLERIAAIARTFGTSGTASIAAALEHEEGVLTSALASMPAPLLRPLRTRNGEPKVSVVERTGPATHLTAFRRPTDSELVDAVQAAVYHRARIAHHTAIQLQNVTIARAYMRARLTSRLTPLERIAVERQIRSLAELRDQLSH